MGIVNTTPDSFSDGGQFHSPERAYQHAMSLLEGGANVIDIGGESTRPGASPVPLEEEWQRVGPVIQRLAKVKDCIISIDTVKSEIARRALEEGAHIINDISALRFDENMVNVAHHYAVPVILMHMQGMPQTMQKNPTYTHLMEEIITFFQKQIDYAGGHGVTQLIIDPGIGFGKRVEDNYELIRRIAEFRVFGYPILLGASRKSFIGKLSGNLPRDRIGGTIAANLYAYQKGVQMFRVHDVKELKEALQVFQGIQDLKAS
ncbi:MAG: dihydropteroate synthase [Calditrichaeota bacterium]|nr:MAG: dihydropteroate synthase [Calditrichota bacterium]